jgi:catechol 2,3-dioxygenase-like lactoylglutathione lyase family enzyme
MISGTHVVINSTDAEADRAFFRDVLDFKHVDAGHGWLIFALPKSEAAFHPAEKSGGHALYLMCDDLKTEIASLAKQGVKCTNIQEARWGSITEITLPSGGRMSLYQPKHPRPEDLS